MVRRVRIKDHYGEQRIFALRSIVAAVVVSVLLLSVASRLFYLQVLRHEYYAELSQGNRVRTDPILLERVLLNLVSNAVRYTPQGGVLVGCRRHAGTLDVEVLDTGPGVPADQREKIFGEFVRLGDRDGRGQPGLGLGLAIVQRLCDLMALPMTFESALGRGSRFSVTLPRAPSQVGHHERPTEPALIIDTSAQPVVVVVEDDALVLEGMSGLLRSWGCHVVPFGSAKAALADVSLWEGSPPNLIIADYSLPEGKSGLELIATLRSAFGGEIAAFLISGDVPDATSQADAERKVGELIEEIARGFKGARPDIKEILPKPIAKVWRWRP